MLHKIHVATVFQDGFTRILIYLDGSVEVLSLGKSIAIESKTIDELIAARQREMLRVADHYSK